MPLLRVFLLLLQSFASVVFFVSVAVVVIVVAIAVGFASVVAELVSVVAVLSFSLMCLFQLCLLLL